MIEDENTTGRKKTVSGRETPMQGEQLIRRVAMPGAILAILGAGYFILPDLGFQFLVWKGLGVGPTIPIILIVVGLTMIVGTFLYAVAISHTEKRRLSGLANAERTYRMKKCPACGARYDPTDYDSNSSRWLCSQCNSELPHK